MVMRGMKVSLEKRTYITKDCKELLIERYSIRKHVDPLGYAVERCYSLYPLLKGMGRREVSLGFAESVWANETWLSERI